MNGKLGAISPSQFALSRHKNYQNFVILAAKLTSTGAFYLIFFKRNFTLRHTYKMLNGFNSYDDGRNSVGGAVDCCQIVMHCSIVHAIY